jgi:hypothetical protein
VPARPFRRSLTACVLLTGLTASVLAAASPAVAAPGDRPLSGSLRAAIADGSSELTELPRAILRRGDLPAGAALRTRSSTTRSGPTASGNLTAAAVSNFVVDYVEDGATWTAEAKSAFESAVQIWERTLESRVPILIEATATTFDNDPSILGGAGPWDFLANTQGTPALGDDVFEPLALYNARTGQDAAPEEPDIAASFNPGLGGLYFGTDGNPPADAVDFRTIVLHEIGHGLGLVGTADVVGDTATIGDTNVPGRRGVRSSVSYDQFTYRAADAAGNGGKRLLAMADGSSELAAALTDGQLFWSGQLARTAAGGGKVKLYAPTDFFPGTSYGHLDEDTFPGEDPNGLMTPFVEPGEALSDIGQIATGMLADMGFAMPTLAGARYTALEPVRLLDTREGTGAPKGAVTAGGVVDLRVAGVHGVPANATAVVLNVTGVSPSETTDIRVYPTPVVLSPVPVVSNLNLARGITRANLVTVPVGNNGRVRLRNNAGSVGLLADLAGFYAPGAASTFTAGDPVRILDTREGRGREGTTRVGAGETFDLVVAGTGSPVPAGATAVALTVTAVSATASTDVRVYPTPATADAAPPVVSNLNVRPGGAVPNVVIVKVGRDGKVRLRNQSGAVHLLADVAGWYDAAAGGSLFRPVAPVRILDTRTRLGTSPTAATTVGAGQSIPLRAGGRGQVPSLASAAVLNVTGVGATATTDVRVYPSTATQVPVVSNLNLVRGQTAADLVVVKLGNGSVRLRNSAGQVALLADVAGWFGPAS